MSLVLTHEGIQFILFTEMNLIPSVRTRGITSKHKQPRTDHCVIMSRYISLGQSLTLSYLILQRLNSNETINQFNEISKCQISTTY